MNWELILAGAAAIGLLGYLVNTLGAERFVVGSDYPLPAGLAHPVEEVKALGLGEAMLAVMADSPSLARWQMRDAMAFAAEQAIPLEIVSTGEMDNADYRRNDAMRCFHCKDALFGVMERFAAGGRWAAVAYGVNVDDQGDWRPGQEAARRHGVAAPLLEAGLGKAEIRALAAQAGLRVWDKPAAACLSSRIEYGRPVTREALEQQLGRLQQDNAAKLEQMRQTVDEKLHATLEQRLSESFKQVSERLELVHKGLGEMQSLAAGVGDLKKVLSNVKNRGVMGEVQLAALLEQILTPEQYETNVATRPGSRDRVEFAIKLPGRDSEGTV